MDITNIILPAGYENPHIGYPKKGDYLIQQIGYAIHAYQCPADTNILSIIVDKKFVWPSELKVGIWLFKDTHGNWWISTSKPFKSGVIGGLASRGDCIRVDSIFEGFEGPIGVDLLEKK